MQGLRFLVSCEEQTKPPKSPFTVRTASRGLCLLSEVKQGTHGFDERALARGFRGSNALWAFKVWVSGMAQDDVRCARFLQDHLGLVGFIHSL